MVSGDRYCDAWRRIAVALVWESRHSMPVVIVVCFASPSSFPILSVQASHTKLSLVLEDTEHFRELVCCLAWISVLVVVDGYVCSSQHHVGWRCCLCSDVVFCSSGFGSECLEATTVDMHNFVACFTAWPCYPCSAYTTLWDLSSKPSATPANTQEPAVRALLCRSHHWAEVTAQVAATGNWMSI